VISFVCVRSEEEQGDMKDFAATFPNVNQSDLIRLEQQLVATPLFGGFKACPLIRPAPDTDNVHNLRPGNIRIIAALGDSVTTGSSAKDTSILNLKEYRGLSYAMGGDQGVISAVTLLQQYTPPGFPIGFSTGIGTRVIVTNGYNAAQNGARNADIPEQAIWLVDRIKTNNTAANFNNYWKVISIWIGSNNLCDLCNDQNTHSPANFESAIDRALSYLRANLPRTFVSLVANLDVTQIYDFKTGTCSLLHSYECPCGASSNNATRQAVLTTKNEYTKRLYNLEAKYAAYNDRQFAVVVQPFLDNAVIPSREWLSAADCFHPSAIAHQAMGIGLWNNLISPKAQKSNKLVPGEQPLCPTDNTLFYTN